jgi:NADH dehydrogenase FAD-containing subunit
MKRRTIPSVLILGGGFAGLAAAQELRADQYDVTLVARNRWFEFLPNIHELLSGVKTPDLLRVPLHENLRRLGHRFIRDTVTSIDPEACSIATTGRRAVSYDALIVACGGVDATRGVAGVVDHAYAFKSVDQCARIGRRLARLAARKKPARIVVVGGGLEGIEALGEILRLEPSSCGLHISLVEAQDRLLSEAPKVLDAHVRELCADDAVDFLMQSPVRGIESDGVVLEDGTFLASDLTIWTGGPAPPALLASSGLAPERAWAPVDEALESKGHPAIFIAGDAADLPTAMPKQGYHALDMGVCAARNASRRLANRDLKPFHPSGKPTLISFGDRSCFLSAGRLVVAGPALAAAKEAVFGLVMARLDGRPLDQKLLRMVSRADRATRRLLWPTLSSLSKLRRQSQIRVLAS